MIAPNPLAGLPADHFPDRRHLWRVFRATHFFRLSLALLLLAGFALDDQSRLFGKQHPALFLGTVLVYLALVLVAIASSYWRRPILAVQTHLQMLLDLLALTVMIHASGGLASSLNTLLITAVAASSILLPLSSALLAAALSFFLLVGSWLLGRWTDTWLDLLLAPLRADTDDLVRLGVLGATLFLAAALTHALAERARRGEALARQRTLELLEVAELNQGIVRHLQNGVVVVDAAGQILLLNDTARELLDGPETMPGSSLGELSSPLAQRWRLWRAKGGAELAAFRPAEHRPELIPRFTRLSGRQANSALILLEDSAQAAERLRQIKLAALGRLTAGIAHEIRNPLAAISHAAQLLEESVSTNPTDRRLARIIHDNIKRANRIIGDVLDLARRDRVKPEPIALRPWLDTFIQEFTLAPDGTSPEWCSNLASAEHAISFDPHHLRQVLWNLCANACQHGARPGQRPRIELRAGLESGRGRPFLEVRDDGPGVTPEHLEHLFEPFFTTRSKGTGLGLYLARELCEANRAQLQYLAITGGGGCFRITFAPASHIPEMD